MRDCFSYVLFKDCLKFSNTRAVSGLCCLASVVMFVLLVGLQEGGGSVGWNYFFISHLMAYTYVFLKLGIT